MITAKLLLVYLLETAAIIGLNVDTAAIDIEEAYCLAENVYYEAKGEDIQGQFAVASVTLNRVKDERFPDTICGVVRQSAVSRANNKPVCAFSWYCENAKRGREIPVRNRDGSLNQKVIDQFRVASTVAISTMAGTVKDNTHGATHFHNPYISSPDWANELKFTKKLGNHAFYRLPTSRRR